MPWENLGNYNIWELLFEQTPTPIRYAFGILTLGAFTAFGAWWRIHNRRIERIENRIDNVRDDLNARIERSNKELAGRLDKMNQHLVQIAINTNGSHRSNDRT